MRADLLVSSSGDVAGVLHSRGSSSSASCAASLRALLCLLCVFSCFSCCLVVGCDARTECPRPSQPLHTSAERLATDLSSAGGTHATLSSDEHSNEARSAAGMLAIVVVVVTVVQCSFLLLLRPLFTTASCVCFDVVGYLVDNRTFHRHRQHSESRGLPQSVHARLYR
jgi:hypothetical protein